MLLELETLGGIRVLFPLKETTFYEENKIAFALLHGMRYQLKYPYTAVKDLVEKRMSGLYTTKDRHQSKSVDSSAT